MEQRGNRLEVLQFDRQDLDARTLRQLREVLTDDQQTQLRLPEERVDEEEADRGL